MLSVIQIVENAPTQMYISKFVTHPKRSSGASAANPIATAGGSTNPASILPAVTFSARGLPLKRQYNICAAAVIIPANIDNLPILW